MGDVNHAYLTIGGSYNEAALNSEYWQTGIRIGLSNAEIPDVGAPSLYFTAAADALTRSETNWDASSNFLFDGGIVDIDPTDWLQDQIAPAVQAWIETSAANISDVVVVETLSLYAIGADGKVINTDVGPAKATATANVEINGTGSASPLPLECSHVASLRTANTTRRGRGRCYLPVLAVNSIGGDSLISTATATATANAFALMLTDMSLSLTDAYAAPIVIGDPWTTQFKIKSVRVGNVMDAQRRRRRQLDETYQSQDVPYSP